jgi:hypothetical protein
MIKCPEKITRVSAHNDIGVTGNAILGVKFTDIREIQWRSHDDLNFFKEIYMCHQFPGLMLAMITIRTEDHDDGSLFFIEVLLGKKAAVGHPRYFKRGYRRKTKVYQGRIGLGISAGGKTNDQE